MKNSCKKELCIINILIVNYPLVGFISGLLKGLGRSPITFADLPIYLATQDKQGGGVSMNEKGKVDRKIMHL